MQEQHRAPGSLRVGSSWESRRLSLTLQRSGASRHAVSVQSGIFGTKMVKFERSWIKAEVWNAEPERDARAAGGSAPALTKAAEVFPSGSAFYRLPPPEKEGRFVYFVLNRFLV